MWFLIAVVIAVLIIVGGKDGDISPLGTSHPHEWAFLFRWKVVSLVPLRLQASASFLTRRNFPQALR